MAVNPIMSVNRMVTFRCMLRERGKKSSSQVKKSSRASANWAGLTGQWREIESKGVWGEESYQAKFEPNRDGEKLWLLRFLVESDSPS